MLGFITVMFVLMGAIALLSIAFAIIVHTFQQN